jgi:hypothetical protein
MSAYRVIDKLEFVVRQGVWLPFGWRAVNAERLNDLIEKLRSTLPEDANRGRKTADSLDRATDRTAGLTKETEPALHAHETRAKAFESSDLLAAAQAKADDLVAQAQAAARDIRRGADEYADQVLSSLDSSLAKALAAVQKGRQTLAVSSALVNGKKQREASTL